MFRRLRPRRVVVVRAAAGPAAGPAAGTGNVADDDNIGDAFTVAVDAESAGVDMLLTTGDVAVAAVASPPRAGVAITAVVFVVVVFGVVVDGEALARGFAVVVAKADGDDDRDALFAAATLTVDIALAAFGSVDSVSMISAATTIVSLSRFRIAA